MKLLMKNKEKVMEDYFLNLKLTVLKNGLKLLCDVVLVPPFIVLLRWFRPIGISGHLSDKVFWFLSPLQPKTFSLEGGKNNLHLGSSASSIPLQKVYFLP